ncbi:MAG: LytTR family DNA-binding domain-containing protein [Lentimicrobiaceae bacterium]|jgi:DNA-binding LytR/AlgR family response regulator|nr:LytTR family DNA-binding domain-containing protein [Lentimicrobiaceae bacterium]MDD4596907.1 LytTR family DNA-binding domain-containing protein [Lentimicrobiaceae bacterium]MDY0025773.1 LytTR family DNA-binding domain-containing protein [Lentimicrobium sp.]
MNCIVVDDEPMALDLIKSYILKTERLNLVNGFTDPFKALNFLMNNHVELVFLDINMPDLSGIQLLKSLPYQPIVIFTTAYPEFGAESYEYNALDYLLKPFKYDRFMRAINKLPVKETKVKALTLTEDKDKAPGILFLKSGTQIHRVMIEDITCIEAQGNYIHIHTKNKRIMTLKSMEEMMQQLPDTEFIRIHKSFIVSIKHIDIIEKHQVIVCNKAIPIGVTYREYFNQHINELRFGKK